MEAIKLKYDEHGFLGILIAAITPIPYKIFTITAGVTSMAFLPFVLASMVGRGFRFFLACWSLLRAWFRPGWSRSMAYPKIWKLPGHEKDGGGVALISTPVTNLRGGETPSARASLEPATVSWSVIAIAPRLSLWARRRISKGDKERLLATVRGSVDYGRTLNSTEWIVTPKLAMAITDVSYYDSIQKDTHVFAKVDGQWYFIYYLWVRFL